MSNSPTAEDANYWKASKTSPDTWMGGAKQQIEDLGGTILLNGREWREFPE